MFSRCASLDDEGWLRARVINVTFESEDRRRIRCVKHTDHPVYRKLERLPPFVRPKTFNTYGFVQRLPVYQPNLTVRVQMDEGAFRAFPWWPGPDVDPQARFAKVKNVSVVNSEDMHCFFWRSPLPAVPNFLLGISNEKLTAFVCQNETGNVVDYYGVSIQDLPKRNVRVLSRNESNMGITSTQFTVSTEFKFLGSLEFMNRIGINGSHFIRRFPTPSIHSPASFQSVLERMLYERASNVSIRVPGDEQKHLVELDSVVVFVGGVEVLSVLMFALFLKFYSQYRRKDVQRVNTVNGLSQCWAQNKAPWNGSESQMHVTLRLRRKFSHPCFADQISYEYLVLPEREKTAAGTSASWSNSGWEENI
ncbi:hypothetical protein FGB62_123g019 [Gracilaria domingensis]|nr:hypothetical protein FGB62_123g019 [Gracilaria domingensis]